MSSAHFLKRNLAYLKVGIAAKLQYPASCLAGIVLQPLLAFLVEALFWVGCFEVSGLSQIGGFTLAQYLTYLLWLLLQFATANWRFERAMIQDINSGAVNAMLVRPGSFYGLHFGDLLGYKLMTLLVAVPLMFAIAYGCNLPLAVERLPLALLMGVYYLLFLHTLNVAIASTAFFFDHVYSLNTTKNMLLWFLTGELFPLDLLPPSISRWLLAMPFSAGNYLPASYLSGRIGADVFLQGFVSLTLGMGLIALITCAIWRKGLRTYTGTGA
jgi:ABC-2 type transport system permease protein